MSECCFTCEHFNGIMCNNRELIDQVKYGIKHISDHYLSYSSPHSHLCEWYERRENDNG